MFPLVRDLADDGIAVVVTCRVLGFSPQAFYKWRANPVTDREWNDAHLINAIYDIHGDDPEFGYRFIADELDAAGMRACENRVARLCAQQQVFSTTIRRKRGKGTRPGRPVHDDHLQRVFTAEEWLSPGVADSREVGTLVSTERRKYGEGLPRGDQAQGCGAVPAGR